MNLLVHICCAPCFTYPRTRLIESGIDFTGFAYNPNIHPFVEFLYSTKGWMFGLYAKPVKSIPDSMRRVLGYVKHGAQHMWTRRFIGNNNKCCYLMVCYSSWHHSDDLHPLNDMNPRIYSCYIAIPKLLLWIHSQHARQLDLQISLPHTGPGHRRNNSFFQPVPHTRDNENPDYHFLK